MVVFVPRKQDAVKRVGLVVEEGGVELVVELVAAVSMVMLAGAEEDELEAQEVGLVQVVHLALECVLLLQTDQERDKQQQEGRPHQVATQFYTLPVKKY